jgi:phage-related protein
MTATAIPLQNKINQASSMIIIDNAYEIPFGDAYAQTGEIGLNPEIEVWDIVYNPLTSAELATANAVYKTVRTILPVSWTTPTDNVLKTFKVVKDSRKVSANGRYWMLTLQLKQVFEP